MRRGGDAGHIHKAEGELIHRVFVLNDRRARDLMTPRKDVIGIRADASIREAVGDVSKHAHSRYPVYGENVDHIRGLVMSHDLFEAVGAGKEDQPVSSIIRDVIMVPGEMRSDALLMLFRKRHVHMAVVLEGNKTAGIVTLEDVLEELVGEIEDERDAGKILS